MSFLKYTLVLIISFTATSGVISQRSIEKMITNVMEEAKSTQRLNGKYYVADFSNISKTKVIPPDVVRSVVADQYKIRSLKVVRRTVFGKIRSHVKRFEFRDLELIRQDEIEADSIRIAAKIERDSLLEIEARRRDSIQQVEAALLAEINEDRKRFLPGMWLTSADQIVYIYENGVVEIVELKGTQQSLRVYWKYDPIDGRFLISNNGQDFINFGRINFSEINTVTIYRHDGNNFTMSRTTEDEIIFKLRSEEMARLFLEGIGGGMIDMTPDEEYDLWLDWRF